MAHRINSINEILRILRNTGFIKEFLRDSRCLYCVESGKWITPMQFEVVESFLFETLEKPDASRVIYAILCKDGMKGSLIEGYGVFSDNMSVELSEKLNVKNEMDYLPLQNALPRFLD